MKKHCFAVLLMVLSGLAVRAEHRRWTVADGLPTGEVQQIARLKDDEPLQRFVTTDYGDVLPTAAQQRLADSLGLGPACNTAETDWQGGLWIGTRNDGIVYLSPRQPAVGMLPSSDPLADLARSTSDAMGNIWRCKASGLEREHNGQTTLYNRSNVKGLPYDHVTQPVLQADVRCQPVRLSSRNCAGRVVFFMETAHVVVFYLYLCTEKLLLTHTY